MEYVIVILFLIIFILLFRSRAMAIQRFAAMELVLVLLITMSYFYSCQRVTKSIENQYMYYASKCLEQADNFAAGLDELTDLSTESVQEELSVELDSLLQDNLPHIENKSEKNYTNVAILETKGEEYTSVFCLDEDKDFTKTIEFKENIYPLIEQAVQKQEVTYSVVEHEYGVLVIADIDAQVPQRVLCVEIPITQIQATLEETKEQYLFMDLLILGVGTAVVVLVIVLQDREWKRMIQAMSVVSAGKEEWKKPRIYSNEMQIIWNSLSEIVKNVARMNYEKYKMFQAYYRFAPKQIEKILNKSSITDVMNGDVTEINGILVLASLSGDQMLRRREYTQSMNYKYLLLSQFQKEQDGILLSGDCDLKMLKYMFLEDTEKAIHFGIDALTAFEEKGIYKKENALLLMHKSNFTYGISGDEEQALTYIVSGDLSVLQSYIKALGDVGIRMAVTDSVIDTVKQQFTCRYIGFIEETNSIFKLYEVLDVYPEKERRQRMNADAKLQQGITLFYKDDFYLARSAFTEALKECPSDGLAKWYLFTCEERLNHPERKDTSYGLFANSER